MRPVLRCLGYAALLLLPALSPAASRFEEFTRKFAKTDNQASIVASTFVGGPGTEWLAGGGFQPDGTIVAGGVALGPVLELGTPATVIGPDGPISAPTPRRTTRPRRPEAPGSTRQTDTIGWNHQNATAFIARLSSDLQMIKSVTRFGWRLGGLTGLAVDAEGAIYICGPATPAITNLCADAVFAKVQLSRQPDPNLCSLTFLAKLDRDASKPLWVRCVEGSSPAPEIEIDRERNILFVGADLRTFDPNGKLLSTIAFGTNVEGQVAVNPVDHSFAIGGEHHWLTGREPYRDPVLHLFKPNGSLNYELYNWDGPFVGLNHLRTVADSAIRGLSYNRSGGLVLHARSDGTNSVFFREPNDVFTTASNMSGLGFNVAGAGVISCAYVIKLDEAAGRVSAGTLWVSYLGDRDKPNSITINTMACAADGSVCIGGNSSRGLIQTGNAFPGEPGGNYVAVLSSDLKSLRFSSTLPATGQFDLGNGNRWAIASGVSNGRTLGLFASAAIEREGEKSPPLTKARQEKFGGGMADGHLLLLDLGAAKGQSR